MKLEAAELLFCETPYEVMLWFSKFYGMRIPSEAHFYDVLANPDIVTIGIWLDSCGTLAIVKYDQKNYLASFFEKSVIFPVNATAACDVVRGLENYKYGMPPRITLWTTTDISNNIELDFDLSRFLSDREFYRDFSNNWDYF